MMKKKKKKKEEEREEGRRVCREKAKRYTQVTLTANRSKKRQEESNFTTCKLTASCVLVIEGERERERERGVNGGKNERTNESTHAT